MKNKALLASAAAIVMLSAFLFAPVRNVVASVAYQGMDIVSSTIDSTQIGLNSPSIAKFTSAGVGNLAAGANGTGEVPWTPQGYTGGTYFGFNQNGGSTFESDFINYSSTSAGGFYWWNPPATGLTAPIMTLTPAGVLTVAEVNSAFHGNLTGNSSGTQSSYLNALIDGNDTLALSGSLGLNLGWNESAGGGESDFVNQQSTGTPGGFNWYNTVTHALGTAIMSLSGTGTLTVAQVNGNAATATTAAFANAANTANSATTAGSATTAASTTGNSATATQLAATPAQCPTGTQATGIAANGAANCTSTKTLWSSSTSVCTTASGAAGTCTTSLSWPGSGFSGATYLAVCQGYNMSSGSGGAIVNISVTSQTLTTIGVTLTNGTASQGNPTTFSEITCVANGT